MAWPTTWPTAARFLCQLTRLRRPNKRAGLCRGRYPTRLHSTLPNPDTFLVIIISAKMTPAVAIDRHADGHVDISAHVHVLAITGIRDRGSRERHHRAGGRGVGQWRNDHRRDGQERKE